MVVDLAVEDNLVPPGCRPHGLMSERTQVDDRQPTMSECDPGVVIDPRTCVVGATMTDSRRHGFERSTHHRTFSAWCPESSDAAHAKV